MHQIVFEHARALGVDIRLDQNITEYWEDQEAGKAGVIVNGDRLEGDVVVGADGVRSKARQLVLVRNLLLTFGCQLTLLFQGYEDKPKHSGYAIYRAWFNAQESGIDKDPLTEFMVKNGDGFYGWIGQYHHFPQGLLAIY